MEGACELDNFLDGRIVCSDNRSDKKDIEDQWIAHTIRRILEGDDELLKQTRVEWMKETKIRTICTAKCDVKDCPYKYKNNDSFDPLEKRYFGDLSYTTVCRKED